MKKLITLALLLAGSMTTAYAQANLFDAADCDANGWLWFDTQEKIDKYVGDANSDKPIKLLPSAHQVEVEPDIFESLPSIASPDRYGAGTDGYLFGFDESGTAIGADAKKGALVLAYATASQSQNGGSILMHLPSCYYCEAFFSAESRLTPCLKGGIGHLETLDLGMIRGFAPPFSKLSGAGQATWKMHELVNANTNLTIKQEGKVTVHIINDNGSKAEMYVHGLKVQVYGEGSGTTEIKGDIDRITIAQTGRFVSLSRKAEINVYNAAGAPVLSTVADAIDLGALGSGLYIIQARDNNAVTTQKILIP